MRLQSSWRSATFGVVTRFVLGLALAALGAGIAASAAAGVGATSTSVVDATYSCRVQEAQGVHYADFEVAVGFPPLNGFQRPAHVSVTTEPKTVERNGIKFLVPQVYFEHVKDSLKVDRDNCRKSPRSAALTHAGLGAAQTTGEFQQRCITKKRVLVRYRITMSKGVPESALVVVRNDDTKSRPVAFFRWAPHKLTGYLGNCVDNPPHVGA